MLYRAVRPFLFALDPETAHRLGLKSLDVLTRLGAASLVAAPAPRVPVRVMGLDFPNPVGLAAGLHKVYAHAGFVTANISSPNTKDLRALQQADGLDALLASLTAERDLLAKRYGNRVPLAVKVAPDLDDAGIETIADRVTARGIDAVIATNTTVSREGVGHLPASREPGGLSGAPLKVLATVVVAKVRRSLPAREAVIGLGGI